MNKYNKAMDEIKVTEDMRSRILQNIEKELGTKATEEVQTESSKSAKIVEFKSFIRNAATIAAALVGTVIISNVLFKPDTNTSSYSDHFMDTEYASEATAPAFEAADDNDSFNEISDYELVEVDGISVKFYGNDGLYYQAEWETEDGSFSVDSDKSEGISLEEMKKLVRKKMK